MVNQSSKLSLILILVFTLATFTNGQELNQQSTINGLDAETTAFLDWFYVNELLPYFFITSNQLQSQSPTINPEGLLFSPTTIKNTNWLSPPKIESLQQQSNHYHQHVNLPPNQLIANIMPNILSPLTVNNLPINPQSDKIVFPKINNPNIQSFYFKQPQQLNHQTMKDHRQRQQTPRTPARRHFGTPLTGMMTNDNFDKEKTIDESLAEKMNPLIKINVKIRENIKGLKDLEATFQKQPMPQRIFSTLLLRALLNPLRK